MHSLSPSSLSASDGGPSAIRCACAALFWRRLARFRSTVAAWIASDSATCSGLAWARQAASLAARFAFFLAVFERAGVAVDPGVVAVSGIAVGVGDGAVAGGGVDIRGGARFSVLRLVSRAFSLRVRRWYAESTIYGELTKACNHCCRCRFDGGWGKQVRWQALTVVMTRF